jgi:Flavin containing amine oxidoreductase
MGLAGLDDEETPYLILNGHAYLGQPILAFLYGGSHAKRVEDWTDAETIADCVRVLKKICGRQIPHPVDYRMTRWGHEQYSRMAFTYIPPGVDGFQELQAMSEPVYDHTGTKPTLMFAGEHTSVFHPSTIHGAFLSGIREAYRLDLALFPQANDGLEFSDSELYERTFDVRRRYFESSSRSGKHESKTNEKNKEDKVGIPKNRKQHRRRGAAGVMTLRKRPNPSKTSAAINGTVPASPSVSGARKSPRAPAVFNVEDAPDRDSSAPALWLLSDLSEKPNMASLDDLTLLRGLESYGSNYEYLLAMVLPVQLDDSNLSRTQQLSLPQLRKRCQMLLPTLRSLKAMSTPSWKRWVAKTVFSPTSGDPNSLPASDKNANESAPPRIPNPKPTTSLNSGATSDSGNRPPPAEIRTRLGRLVRSPSLTSRSSIGDIDGPTVSCYWSQSGSRTITEEARARHTVPAHTSTKTRFGRLVKRPEG